jgi:hypothetical protein
MTAWGACAAAACSCSALEEARVLVTLQVIAAREALPTRRSRVAAAERALA